MAPIQDPYSAALGLVIITRVLNYYHIMHLYRSTTRNMHYTKPGVDCAWPAYLMRHKLFWPTWYFQMRVDSAHVNRHFGRPVDSCVVSTDIFVFRHEFGYLNVGVFGTGLVYRTFSPN